MIFVEIRRCRTCPGYDVLYSTLIRNISNIFHCRLLYFHFPHQQLPANPGMNGRTLSSSAKFKIEFQSLIVSVFAIIDPVAFFWTRAVCQTVVVTVLL